MFFVVVVFVGARLLLGYTCSKVFRLGVLLLGLLWQRSMVLDKSVPMLLLAGSVAIRWRAQLLATIVQSRSEVVGTTHWPQHSDMH